MAESADGEISAQKLQYHYPPVPSFLDGGSVEDELDELLKNTELNDVQIVAAQIPQGGHNHTCHQIPMAALSAAMSLGDRDGVEERQS